MNDYILLMYDSAESARASTDSDWDVYIKKLAEGGRFGGGSAIGKGWSASKAGGNGTVDSDLSGFIRVSAASLEEARNFLAGNPTYEGGGRVDIRELPNSSLGVERMQPAAAGARSGLPKAGLEAS
jgi:hypothetical protein